MEQKIGSSRLESVGEVMGDARSSGGAELRTQMKTQCSENKILSGVTPGSETGKGARQLLKEPACPGLHGLVLH